ncbi:MAG: hypothetical protein ACXWD8_12705 [Mycobacterium sp.]
MIDLTTTVRPTFQPTAEPSPVLVVPATGGTTLITEQQVLFSTAAAVPLPRVKPSRWAMAIKSVSSVMSALFTDSRPPAQHYQARRYAYLENALMSREMDRL